MPELLSCGTIGNIKKGAFGMEVDALIGKALLDCDDRPNLEDVRKIVITLEIAPDYTDGVDTTVAYSGSAKLSLPGMKKLTESLTLVRGEDEKGHAVVGAVMPFETQDRPGQKNMFGKDEK